MKGFSKIKWIMITALLLQALYLPLQAAAAPAPAAPSWTPKIQYLALGDSLAFGINDENALGTSYTDLLAYMLEAQGNLEGFSKWHSSPGYTTGDVLQAIRANGSTNFDERTKQEAIAAADLITISAGANDVLSAVYLDRDTFTIDVREDEVETALQQVGQNLVQIGEAIHQLNADVDVYIMGYYNPFPHLPASQQPEIEILLGWLNEVIEGAAETIGAVYVPTAEVVAKEHLPNEFNIHPNFAGYQAIAKEFWKALEANYEWLPQNTLRSANVTATSVNLQWTPARADSAVTYSVYNGASHIATVTDTTYTVSSLQPRTTYTFSVKATNEEGLTSLRYPTIEVTTNSRPSGGGFGGPILGGTGQYTSVADGFVTFNENSLDLTTVTAEDGTVTVTVTIRDDAWRQAVEQLKNLETAPRLFIQLDPEADAVILQLSSEQLAELQQELPETTVDFAFDSANIHQAVKELELGSADHVELSIKHVSASLLTAVENQASARGITLVNAPVELTVSLHNGDEVTEVPATGRTIGTESSGSVNLSAARYDAGAQEFRFVPATFSRENGQSVASIKNDVNTPILLIQYSKSFQDTTGHWAQGAVENLASKLLVEGRTDSDFAPEASLNRAEFVTLLVRALDLSASPTSSSFTDVSNDAWYSNYVLAAAANGLVDGFEDGTFRPEATVTREQLAVITVRSLGLLDHQAGNGSGSADNFADVEMIADWSKSYIDQAVALGLINGMSDGSFRPADSSTRAQSVTLLERFLQEVDFID